jgi:hypothetical protein
VSSWAAFEEAAPELARAVRLRFAADPHAVLATMRRDGSPRLSGLETHIRGGELWLAMMPDSRKADDLRRDPRFALHSRPDPEVVDGDATVNGRAAEVADADELARFVEGLPRPPPDSGVGLFRAEITGASLTRVEGNELVVAWWHPGEHPHEVRRT